MKNLRNSRRILNMHNEKGISDSLLDILERNRIYHEAIYVLYAEKDWVQYTDEEFAESRQQARKLLAEINKKTRKKRNETD